VDVHDLPDPKLDKAIPYTVFDLAADQGFVTVGSDGDTAECAQASIGRWSVKTGSVACPDAMRLMIAASAARSNGYRDWLWKRGLGALGERTGLAITVCHCPPGTSRWTRIERRLFTHSSMNWWSRPLSSPEVVVDPISGTTTKIGFTVRAEHDQGGYPTGTEVPDAELTEAPREANAFPGEWNYTCNSTLLESRSRAGLKSQRSGWTAPSSSAGHPNPRARQKVR